MPSPSQHVQRELVLPDYAGAWIGGIMPALLDDREPPSWIPSSVRGARAVVLLVLDGLGWQALQEHGQRLPELSAMEGGPITAVAPTTTSAALTSISTGLPPSQHGLLGYRIRVGGDVLNVLQWRTATGGTPPRPASVQPHPQFGGRAIPLVTRSEFRGSGFTEAHLRDGSLQGWRTTSVLLERCRRLVADGSPLVYAYYDGVDNVAHEFGLHDTYYAAELESTDRLVGAMRNALPGDCALVVTADHGQVHISPDNHRGLEAVAGMVAAFSGEGRFRSLYARPGAVGELYAACVERYGDEAWVLRRDELFDDGWFGPGATAMTRGRVGDVTIAARDDVVFLAPDAPREGQLVGFHGSVTAAEMQVPLLAARGRGPS